MKSCCSSEICSSMKPSALCNGNRSAYAMSLISSFGDAAYLIQYWPSFGYWVLNKIGPARAQAYKTGKSGYDVSLLRKSS